MGGKGSGRLSKTQSFIRQNSNPYNSVGNLASVGNEVLVIPNHSGDNSAGTVLKTPVNDTDIVNKKYVDDSPGGDRLAAGSIVTYGSTTAPDDWLLCD
ncbi:MAG: hypothetical protein GWP19_00995, partial [Planctomycetia bacterium]|nr:hypothetical protein [Planctomycetia bacterium]